MNIKAMYKDEPKLIYTAKAFSTLLQYLGTKHARTQEFMFLGLVEKNENDYIILDFVLPPQETKSAYCETDDEKYPEWLAENIKPELRSKLRCHAHSHVNMSTTPSGTDNKMISELCENVSDFYIQLIVNNELKNTINLYDKNSKLIYENISNYLSLETENTKFLLKINNATDFNIEQMSIKTQKYEMKNGIVYIDDNCIANLYERSYLISNNLFTVYIKNNESKIIYDMIPDFDKEFNKMIKQPKITPYKPYTFKEYDFDPDDDYNYGYDYGLYDWKPKSKGKKRGSK